MYKVTALSVILAAMGVGSAFANPMDIDFTAMEMAVAKGTAQPYKVGFNINLPDFVAEYSCTATLRANTMDVSILLTSSYFRILGKGPSR